MLGLGRRYTGRYQVIIVLLSIILISFATSARASRGDRSDEFRECVDVCQRENCGSGAQRTLIPIHRQLLLWNCDSECDYTCQHIVTNSRIARGAKVVQFHGKWPFRRFLGMQEPASVLFSLANLYVHLRGLRKLRARIPADYPLLPYYVYFAYTNIAAWVLSSIFHTRDFTATEQLDYFGAGAAVLYGLLYTVVRIFRLDRNSPPLYPSLRRAWIWLCLSMYAAHVAYLKLWKWDYSYNMAANIVCGVIQNTLWSWFSITKYRSTGRAWAAWPGIAVAWVMMAMSLEMFDFPPLWGSIDAHSLWHAGTVAPIVLWYNFLVKDARDDVSRSWKFKDDEKE